MENSSNDEDSYYTICLDDETEIKMKHPDYSLSESLLKKTSNTIHQERKSGEDNLLIPTTCALFDGINHPESLERMFGRLTYIDERYVDDYINDGDGEEGVYSRFVSYFEENNSPNCDYCKYRCSTQSDKYYYFCSTCNKSMCFSCLEEVNKNICLFNNSHWGERHTLLSICRTSHSIFKRNFKFICKSCFSIDKSVSTKFPYLCYSCVNEIEEYKNKESLSEKYFYRYGEFHKWIPVLFDKSYNGGIVFVHQTTEDVAVLILDDHGRGGLARFPIKFTEFMKYMLGEKEMSIPEHIVDCNGCGRRITSIPHTTIDNKDYCMKCSVMNGNRDFSQRLYVICYIFGMQCQYG